MDGRSAPLGLRNYTPYYLDWKGLRWELRAFILPFICLLEYCLTYCYQQPVMFTTLYIIADLPEPRDE